MDEHQKIPNSLIGFPSNFLWGAATSSYQVEGNINNNDWAKSAREGRLPYAKAATKHYDNFERDFDIAKSLAHNAHRLSIEWARIEPEEGKFDVNQIEHYRKVLQALRLRGIEPFVTLWHFTLPEWFFHKGGFEHKDAPMYFARYCSHVVGELKGEADFWMTINEPLIWSSAGYLKANWPPFKRSFFSFLFMNRALARSHRLAYKKIKDISPNARVGISKHNICFYSDKKIWNKFASFFMNWFWNERFLNSIVHTQDFIGLNYYFPKKFGKQDNFIKTDMGWSIYPEGIYKLLIKLKKYRKPIYITENGIADATDKKRTSFISEHLVYVRKSIDEGVEVCGYFYWSLLDNFEWSFGFEKRFGLVEIDYSTMERKIRASAFEYKRIIENNTK